MDIKSLLRKGSSYNPSDMLGYNEMEVAKIEKLLGYPVSNQIKQFLTKAGVCAGGLIGLDQLFLCRKDIHPGKFYRLHQFLIDELIEGGESDLAKSHPMIIREYEVGCDFVAMNKTDKVFYWDEEEAHDTSMDFYGYLAQASARAKDVVGFNDQHNILSFNSTGFFSTHSLENKRGRLVQTLSDYIGDEFVEMDFLGYSSNELHRLELIYGVSIFGELEEMLRLLGRSCSGLFNSDTLNFYNVEWDMVKHLQQQFLLGESLFNVDKRKINLRTKDEVDVYSSRPLVISNLNSVYTFIATLQGNSIYHWDTNLEVLEKVSDDLVSYLIEILIKDPAKRNKNENGDLLEVRIAS